MTTVYILHESYYHHERSYSEILSVHSRFDLAYKKLLQIANKYCISTDEIIKDLNTYTIRLKTNNGEYEYTLTGKYIN